MRFHVDFDEGSALSFWVVPDNPRAAAEVYIFVDHVFRGMLTANADRRVIRDWGWHLTGQVAFHLDEGIVPGLAAAGYVEVYDVDTLVLIYRRSPTDDLVEGKFLHFSTGLAPDATLDRALFDAFRLSYTRVENIPEETLGYIFDYHYSSSVYIAGRLSARKMRRFIDKNGIRTCAIVEDPFRLLGRQILWLRSAASIADDEVRSWRVAGLANAIAFARSLDLADPKGLRKAFGNLDPEIHDLLADPLTRQFGCVEPNDEVAHQQYVNALEEISHLSVIGHRGYPDAFADSLSGTIGYDIGLFELPASSTEEVELAAMFAQIKPTRDLVGYDVMLVEAVEKLIRDQWSEGAQG